MANDLPATCAATAAQVREFYEEHLYPPPHDDIDGYRRACDDDRRRAESALFWPFQGYREDRSILVAGCGTLQAARYAVRWPSARVVGIDVSMASVAFAQELKRKYSLDNLELRELSVERACELNETFEYVVCSGVLHHLSDPSVGLRALRGILAKSGALHLMVYAPYGRAGIYLLQDYCRRLGVGTTVAEIDDLAATLRALPPQHPIVPLLRSSPDFATTAGLADALLHPSDRAYSVPQLMELLEQTDLFFGRWVRQAAYLPACGAIASAPHAKRLLTLPPAAQYAAMELFRGTMVRHSVVAYGGKECADAASAHFNTDAWLDYVPVRLPGTKVVREKLPRGASAVLINPAHTFTDLFLPIDSSEERLFAAIDGRRSIRAIVRRTGDLDAARTLFQRLWHGDLVVFVR
jgi:SAM-dependent methyltransferase